MSDIATLDEVKAYLRYPADNDDDDALIQMFMASADEVVRRYCGEILTATYDEWYCGGDTVIQLRHFPVASIQSVTEEWGFSDYELTEQPGDTDPSDTSLWAYSLDYPLSGQITRRSVGNVVVPFVNPVGGENVRVQYTTGVAEIPGNVTHGWLDLIAHWWQNSMQRSVPGSAVAAYDASGNESAPYLAGVPYRIIEIMTGQKRTPIIG